MGYCNDDGTHEGYLVGLVFDDAGTFEGHAGLARKEHFEHLSSSGAVPESGRMRELGDGRDNERGEPLVCTGRVEDGRYRLGNQYVVWLGKRVDLRFVKVACSCGWRSPLLHAPSGTYWAPSSVFAPEDFEDQAHALWANHERTSGKAHDGGYSLTELLVNEASHHVNGDDIELLKKLRWGGVMIIERGYKPEYMALARLGLCTWAGESEDGYGFCITAAGIALRENWRRPV